jgi:hypothetical protein
MKQDICNTRVKGKKLKSFVPNSNKHYEADKAIIRLQALE